MYRARSVMSRSFRITYAWNAAIMMENLWPRRLNEDEANSCKKSKGFLQLFFCDFLLLFFLVPSIMLSY